MDDRYVRQKFIGHKSQEKLSKASVIVIGAGGLGSPVLTYLAAAGIGHLALVDSDTVELSNLNRQFLHNTSDIGKPKSDSAREKLCSLNNKIEINVYQEHLTEQNAKNILSGYDIVLGAVDSFKTRYVINKTCASLQIPYIDGGVNGFSGCVIFSDPPHTPCLNCIFPESKEKKKVTGVIGTTAGVIGTIQANIALLLLLGHPNPIENKLLLYDGLRMNIDHIEFKKNNNCPVCRSIN
jgi:adenylyltransferase/sulfurtransferase